MTINSKLQAIINACPARDPKFIMNNPAEVPSRALMATVFYFCYRGQESGVDINEAWAISHTPKAWEWACEGKDFFVPIEINIRPEDVQKAIANLEKRTGPGQSQMCRVVYKYKHGYDRYNKVYDY